MTNRENMDKYGDKNKQGLSGQLTANQISHVLSNSLCDKTSYFDTVMLFEAYKFYFERLKNSNVIEIGPGKNPVCLHYEGASYIGIEPYPQGFELNPEKGEYIKTDALTYLRTLPDNYGVIIGIGVLDIIGVTVGAESRQVSDDYIKELLFEIKRVTKNFSIFIGEKVIKYLGDPDYTEQSSSGGVYMFSSENNSLSD